MPSLTLPLASAQWPHLRILHLNHVHCSADAFAAFICSHPTITELIVGIYCGVDEDHPQVDGLAYAPYFPSLRPDCLPNLRVLCCNTVQTIQILRAPTKSPRVIQHLRGITFKNQQLRSQILKVLPVLPHLDRLELLWSKGWFDLACIGRAVPNLRWLSMRDVVRSPGLLPLTRDDKIASSDVLTCHATVK